MYKYFFIIFIILLFGCSNNSNDLTASVILEKNPSADIIQYNEMIYSNVDSQYEDQDFKKIELLGEIENKTVQPEEFDHLTASSVKEGTRIYSTDEEGDVLLIIASTSEGDIVYRALIEG